MLEVADEIAEPPLQLRPARHDVGLVEDDRQNVGNRSPFDEHCAVGIGLAERHFRIEQKLACDVFRGQPDPNRFSGAIAASEGHTARGYECDRTAPDKLVQKKP